MSDLSIVKIYDYGCPVCEFMATFDSKVTFDLKDKAKYESVCLENILSQSGEKPYYERLRFLLEVHAINPDYTLDLPVYLVTSGKTYLGHVVGEHTQHELKTKLERILNGAQDTQSQGNLDA